MAASVEPIIANRFFLDMGQDGIQSLMEASGIEDETDVQELIQSTKGGQMVVIKTPGAMPIKVGKLTVKYAAFKDDKLLLWRSKIMAGKLAANMKDVTLKVYDLLGEVTLEYNFANAWPSKMAFSNLSSKSNEPLTVTVTLEHEGMRVVKYNM